MFFVWFLPLLALASVASAKSEDSFEYDSKIINGVQSRIDDFPYMVSMQLWGGHMCGGAILDETTILTAAHCVQSAKNPPLSWFLKVQAGSTRIYQGGQVIGVESIRDHPLYDKVTSDYDIAILKLNSKLEFNNVVQPIDLPKERVPAGSVGVAAGWGRTKAGSGGASQTLFSVELPVIEQTTCVGSYPKEPMSERMMCAGYLEGGKDTCQGDSGGPLVVNNTVVGIVSWGYGCAQRGKPGVFADVYQFLDYIQKSR